MSEQLSLDLEPRVWNVVPGFTPTRDRISGDFTVHGAMLQMTLRRRRSYENYAVIRHGVIWSCACGRTMTRHTEMWQ